MRGRVGQGGLRERKIRFQQCKLYDFVGIIKGRKKCLIFPLTVKMCQLFFSNLATLSC